MDIMRGKLKVKSIVASITAMSACALVVFLICISIGNDDVYRNSSDNKASKVRYVLVNEDAGTVFNDRNYNLGNDFVSLVNQDKRRMWGTATRDIADAGIKNGTYDIEVIIPRKFSRRLLSLESVSPKKAGISYRVRKGQNEVTNYAVQENVNSVIRLFNSKVVMMYFSSLIGSLRNAQIQTLTMANSQGSQVDNLRSVVQKPFSNMENQYDALFDKASILKDTDNDYASQQKDFVREVQDTLDGISDRAKSSDDEYGRKLKSECDRTEQLIKKHREETAMYNSQYDELGRRFQAYHGDVTDMLDDFRKNALGERLSEESSALNRANDTLVEQIALLGRQRESLMNMAGNLEKTYGVKAGGSVDENKSAVVDSLTSAFSRKQAIEDIDDSIGRQIESVKFYRELQQGDKLSEYWSEDDAGQYSAAVDIIRRFAAGHVDNYVENSENLVDSDDDSLTDVVSLYFNASSKGEQNTVCFSSSGSVSVDESALKAAVQKAAEEKGVALSGWSDDGGKVSFVLKIPVGTSESENDSSEDKSSETDGKPDDSRRIVAVTFRSRYSFSRGKSCSYSWNVNGNEQNTGNIKSVDSANIQKAMESATATVSTAKQIAAVYGAGDDIADIRKFDGSQRKNEGIVAESGSAAEMSADENVSSSAGEYAGQIAEQYNEIEKEIGVLNVALGDERPSDSTTDDIRNLNEVTGSGGVENLKAYLDNTEAVLEWYHHAVEAVGGLLDDTPPDGKDDEKEEELVKADDVREDDGTDLAGTYQDVMRKIKDSENGLLTNSGKKGNIAPAVRELTDMVSGLRKDTSTIVSNLNTSVKDGRKRADRGIDYADSFSKVMANARKGEEDNREVYDFLSNPVKVTGKYSATRKKSIIPYFMTLIGTIVAMFAGVAMAACLPEREAEMEDAIASHGRAWHNLPAATTVLVVGIVLGIIASFMTMPQAGSVARIGWTVYTVLLEVMMVEFASSIARHHRNVALWTGGALLGMYVMLTPFVGTLTRAGSTVRALYRISPLQNIENGYTVLYNSGRIGARSLLTLIVLAVVSIICSFLVKPDGDDVVEE